MELRTVCWIVASLASAKCAVLPPFSQTPRIQTQEVDKPRISEHGLLLEKSAPWNSLLPELKTAKSPISEPELETTVTTKSEWVASRRLNLEPESLKLRNSVAETKNSEFVPEGVKPTRLLEGSGDADTGCTHGFTQIQYKAFVKENTTYNETHGINVTPPIKSCENASEIVFVMKVDTSGTYEFWINNKTGELHLDGVLDYETMSSHTIDITLEEDKEAGSLIAQALLHIEVVDINDHAPVMSQSVYNLSIQEDAAVGSAFPQIIHATDADSGVNSVLRYVLEGDCPLKVRPDDGQITLKSKLDYELRIQYTCHVYAEETLTKERYNSSFSEVILHVVDINDNIPKFISTRFDFVLSSTLTDGEFVGKVTAYDADSGAYGRVNYTVESPFNEYLTMDSSTGTITVKNSSSPIFSQEQTITFIVIAIDGGDSKGLAEVSMRLIKDYKRWFFYEKAYNFSIHEDAPRGSDVGIVEVNSTIVHYQLDNKHNVPFSVSSKGAITVSGPLDYDILNTSYLFRVVARDNHATVHVNVTVYIVDVNDNRPVFSKSNYTVHVSRLTREEVRIFTVNATDADSGKNSEITYALPSQFALDHYVKINETSGEMFLRKSAVTYEKDFIATVVEATDNGTPPNKETTIVNIVFDLEHVTEYLYLEIEENSQMSVNASSLLGRFSGLRASIDLVIVSGNNTSLFETTISKELSIKSLDYEVDQYHELVINVTGKDSGYDIGTINVEIKVLNLNDNPPSCVPLPAGVVFNIPITASLNQPVFQFVVEDKDNIYDNQGDVNFTISHGDDQVDVDGSTGLVTLKKTLKKTDTFTVTVEASDGKNPVTCEAKFEAFDGQEGYPVFDKLAYFGSVNENKQSNTLVMQITPHLLTFPGANDVTIDVLGNGTEFSTFPPGELVTKVSLDRESRSLYPLAIQSLANKVDGSSAEALKTTVFTLIKVTDVVDQTPRFAFRNNRTIVMVSAPVNTSIAEVAVIDKDSHPQLMYHLNSCRHIFGLDETEEHIIVKEPQSLYQNFTCTIDLIVGNATSPDLDTTHIQVVVPASNQYDEDQLFDGYP